jgi:hypothetical protein
MGSSTLHRLLEPLGDAPRALSRAREILAALADGHVGDPWPQLGPVTTREQFEFVLDRFPTAQIYAPAELPAAEGLAEQLARRGVAFEREEPGYRFMIDFRLGRELADLWPLHPEMVMSVGMTSPFGGPDSTDEDDCTEEEVSAMVAALGPLSLRVSWSCGLRGLPDAKMCGLQLCLNSTWVEQYGRFSPGEFGIWLSVGSTPANRAVADEWVQNCGLRLGGPQGGW